MTEAIKNLRFTYLLTYASSPLVILYDFFSYSYRNCVLFVLGSQTVDSNELIL